MLILVSNKINVLFKLFCSCDPRRQVATHQNNNGNNLITHINIFFFLKEEKQQEVDNSYKDKIGINFEYVALLNLYPLHFLLYAVLSICIKHNGSKYPLGICCIVIILQHIPEYCETYIPFF